MKLKNIGREKITFIAVNGSGYAVDENGFVEIKDEDFENVEGLGFKIVHEEVTEEATVKKTSKKKEVNADKSE